MKAICSFISKRAPAVFAIAVLLLSAPAKGDIALSIESVTGAPGSSGAFDVLLTNTGASSQNIAAFNFELTTANPDITFTDVTTATIAAYLFPASLFGPNITTIASGQTVEAGDADALFNGTDVGPGATFGLGSVSYSIAGGAPNGEVAQINFSAYPATSLADSSGNNVDFTPGSGTITVQTSAVPEPRATALLLAALVIAAVFARNRRRGSRALARPIGQM